MSAEPRDFQCSTPTGLAEQAALDQVRVDQSQVHVFAGDRIMAATSISPGCDGGSAPDFAHPGDGGRIGIAIRSMGSVTDILSKFKVSATGRWSVIGGALVVAFGLGWACASMFNSNSGASLAALDQKTGMSVARLGYEKQPVRRSRRVAKATSAAAKAAPFEANKPKLTAMPPSARLSSSGAAQMHSESQSIILESMERISAPGTPSASGDANLPLRLSPVPETKPTTIAGWIVREVDGGTAVLVGPDRVFTVKTGDAVPGVGRIDSIVRWGNRWIVATTAGLISTE